MRVFRETNVNWIFPHAVRAVQEEGYELDSRNGRTMEFPTPVASCYLNPTERVLFCPHRDANPFFHFFECLWLLAGRNDVAFPASFAKNLLQYSDDGETLNGTAYGFRWRKYFRLENGAVGDTDQLKKVIEMLRNNIYDRRVVLTMWSPEFDLNSPSKDVPCNTQIFFRVRPNNTPHRKSLGLVDKQNELCLSMTVCNRSNDVVYGCYGANAVHFSFLLEYVAGMVGLPVGEYIQMSNSLHAYVDTDVWKRCKETPFTPMTDFYDTGHVQPYPLFDEGVDPNLWDRDLTLFMTDPFSNGYSHSFFSRVAKPLLAAHKAYKQKDYEAALEALAQCKATDWKLACEQWLERRGTRA